MAKRRIFQIAKELNISHTDILSFLKLKNIEVGSHMAPIEEDIYQIILAEFHKDKESVDRYRKEQVRREIHDTRILDRQKENKKLNLLTLDEQRKLEVKEREKDQEDEKKKEEEARNIALKEEEKAIQEAERQKNQEKEIQKEKNKKKNVEPKPTKKLRKIHLSEIQSQVGKGNTQRKTDNKIQKDSKKDKSAAETVRKITAKIDIKSKKKVYKKDKNLNEENLEEVDFKPIKVAEFSNVDELSKIFETRSNDIIQKCMSLGVLATINQRLDWDLIELLAEEFGFKAEKMEDVGEELFSLDITEEDLKNAVDRPPVVTVMGHVDHGKTSLLDYIRDTNVVGGESGGITQHVGAYRVELKDGNSVTFLDTPGHEAFTAMRARGAQITDIVIIVIAADDNIMPQTKEAISHAQAGGVPIIFAINKVDKEGANPDKVKESLASMNLVVEDWGGKIQSQDISALKGQGVDSLLEKVLLEAEVMDLKANPNKNSSGSVLEAYLDKGRGYVSTILVQNGSLKIGDYILAGKTSGKVKAMFDESGNSLNIASPSTPVSVLGLDGAPQAGDPFKVLKDEKEAKMIASKRTQLGREQDVRTQKHLTLDEIGRRIAIGDFKELNVIIKGDVDGSVEALTDSFQNLSTEEIQVNIIFKGVGAITESDVLLASASEAIIVGFNVKPTLSARKLSEKEQIDIRFYSIIYDAINDLKDAMEGMLSLEMKEESTGEAEVRETFKISRVGTIAGCMVTSGKIFRNSNIRVVRSDEMIFEGKLLSLKRFKDDVKEVAKGYDCGIQINEFNDLIEGDIIQCYQEIAVKRKL